MSIHSLSCGYLWGYFHHSGLLAGELTSQGQPHDLALSQPTAGDPGAIKTGATEISIPEISMPEISTPEISMPEISSPEISMPEISSLEIGTRFDDMSVCHFGCWYPSTSILFFFRWCKGLSDTANHIVVKEMGRG